MNVDERADRFQGEFHILSIVKTDGRKHLDFAAVNAVVAEIPGSFARQFQRHIFNGTVRTGKSTVVFHKQIQHVILALVFYFYGSANIKRTIAQLQFIVAPGSGLPQNVAVVLPVVIGHNVGFGDGFALRIDHFAGYETGLGVVTAYRNPAIVQ